MAPAKKAVLITHGGDGPQNADHASRTLAQLGYELDWRMPDQGMALPEIDDSIAITVIYGGGKPADEKDWHTDRYPWLVQKSRLPKTALPPGSRRSVSVLGGRSLPVALAVLLDPTLRAVPNSATTR